MYRVVEILNVANRTLDRQRRNKDRRNGIPREPLTKKQISNDEVKASITVHLIECLNNPVTVPFPHGSAHFYWPLPRQFDRTSNWRSNVWSRYETSPESGRKKGPFSFPLLGCFLDSSFLFRGHSWTRLRTLPLASSSSFLKRGKRGLARARLMSITVALVDGSLLSLPSRPTGRSSSSD